LRKFGYDDSLILHIPESVSSGPDDGPDASWSLTPLARSFLSDLFHQFDSDHDGVLSLQAIKTKFLIVSDPSLPLWHPIRAHEEFHGCFSLPRMPSSSPSSPSSESSGESAPLSESQSLSRAALRFEWRNLVITEVPEAEAENQAKRKKELSDILSGGGCDLVVLAFDSTNSASLAYSRHLESSFLTEEMAGVYVGTKSDQCSPTDDREEMEEDDEWQAATVIDEAAIHCRELDLEPPLVTSASEIMLSAEGELGEMQRCKALEHLARCCLGEGGVDRLRAKPHEEKKRREATERRNRKMIWFGVGVGVAVAVVGYLLTGATGGSSKGEERRDRLGWFRSLFSRRLASSEKAD
jgi:hypothetical protein